MNKQPFERGIIMRSHLIFAVALPLCFSLLGCPAGVSTAEEPINSGAGSALSASRGVKSGRYQTAFSNCNSDRAEITWDAYQQTQNEWAAQMYAWYVKCENGLPRPMIVQDYNVRWFRYGYVTNYQWQEVYAWNGYWYNETEDHLQQYIEVYIVIEALHEAEVVSSWQSPVCLIGYPIP